MRRTRTQPTRWVVVRCEWNTSSCMRPLMARKTSSSLTSSAKIPSGVLKPFKDAGRGDLLHLIFIGVLMIMHKSSGLEVREDDQLMKNSVHLSINPFIHSSFLHPPIYPSVCPSIHPSIYSSIPNFCLSVCSSIIQYKHEYYYSGINPVEFRGHSKRLIIETIVKN